MKITSTRNKVTAATGSADEDRTVFYAITKAKILENMRKSLKENIWIQYIYDNYDLEDIISEDEVSIYDSKVIDDVLYWCNAEDDEIEVDDGSGILMTAPEDALEHFEFELECLKDYIEPNVPGNVIETWCDESIINWNALDLDDIAIELISSYGFYRTVQDALELDVFSFIL